MNKAPTPQMPESVYTSVKNQLSARAVRATGAVLLVGTVLAGCSSGETGQAQNRQSVASQHAAHSGEATLPAPNTSTPGFVDNETPTPSASASVSASATPRKTPTPSASKTAKKFAYTGQDACPWTKETPMPVSSVYTAMGGNAVAAAMLDLRCADFPDLKFGTPKDNDITTKHLYAFQEPTTKSAVLDLNEAGIQQRGPYLSEYLGICQVEGQDFTGTDGRKSDTWLKIITARGQQVIDSSVYVPFAEAGYPVGTATQPLEHC